MADEKPKTSEEEAPKPVRKVKKVLTDETPVAAPSPEAPKAEPKPAPKPTPKKPSAKAPAKAPAKKPAAKTAPARKAAPKAPETKPEPEKKAEAETAAVEPKPEAKALEKKPAKKPEKKSVKPPAKEKGKPAKKARKPTKKEKEEEEEAEEAEEEEEHEARKKPELTEAIRAALRIRREIARRRPTFYRQEWYRYRRLGLKWRKPQGGQSKLRRHLGYRINVVSIGFRGPRPTRGLHPSGFQEVLVHTVAQLKGIDPKIQAVRIGGGVGGRKRHAIQEEADELGLRILNRREE